MKDKVMRKQEKCESMICSFVEKHNILKMKSKCVSNTHFSRTVRIISLNLLSSFSIVSLSRSENARVGSFPTALAQSF